MGVSVLLLTGGALLIVSGIRGQSLVDTALGRAPAPSSDELFADISAGATPLSMTPPGKFTTMDGKRVANWIAVELQWARRHGWHGRVTSGIRTRSEQLSAAKSYGLEHYPNGPLASNHYEGNGVEYPHGAVDVTLPEQLASVLRRYPGGSRLIWAGPVIGDTVHFSANGH